MGVSALTSLDNLLVVFAGGFSDTLLVMTMIVLVLVMVIVLVVMVIVLLVMVKT